ncbi:efflux RND transporter permease subunit [Prolixibacteraceae bacterium JC049]|nr:efflux RND transporter permease subunit [Prolixibacteraceae bacterium JC049]
MNNNHKKRMKTSFAVIMATIALMILGVALLPQLRAKLLPDRNLPSVSVYFSYSGANAVVVDSEITSKLEGLFSNVSGLVKLNSRTGNGYGYITLSMDKESDMDVVRFEVSTLIRQIYPELPDGIGYPQLRVSRPNEEERVEQLIGLTLNGPGQRWQVGNVAETLIKPRLSLIEGVHDVEVSGFTPLVWELSYNASQLKQLSLTANDIANQIKEQYRSANIGTSRESLYKGGGNYIFPVVLKGLNTNETDWENIRIKTEKRLFRLTDLVHIEKRESLPGSYYRINGLSTINIRVLTTPGANQLVVGREVKTTIEQFETELPKDFILTTNYDGTVFLKKELSKIVIRISLALLLLLLFVWLASRSWRYLWIIMVSLLANICIAFIFYYWLGIEIHIYSLAGLTISLGIVIDNTIVMADHIRIGKGISVFRGILAATLTTSGALVVVFFLDERQQLQLLDFVYVILINLSVSLVISFFFIPALLSRFPLSDFNRQQKIKRSRLLVRYYAFYQRSIGWFRRFRVLLLLICILGFGLPTFLMPNHWSGGLWYHNVYNSVFGSNGYNENIRPVVDKALGGSLRLFLKETEHRGADNSGRRTLLTVKANMYEGITLEKSNEIIRRLENFLSGYDEIEQFQTSIYSSSNAVIRIYFHPEHEFDSFPYTLKSELESRVVDMGVGDWTIAGVGRGFDNSLHEGRRNSRVTFYGYNLEELKEYAEQFKIYLEEIQRVDQKSIFVNGRATYSDQINREYKLDFNTQRLEQGKLSQGQLLYQLRKLSDNETSVISLYNNNVREPVIIKRDNRKIPDFWEFYNGVLPISKERIGRIDKIGQLKRERVTNLINKENMEYTMVVEFDFIGSYGQKEYLVGRVIKKMADELPIGYRLKQQTFFGGMWSDKEESNKELYIIGLILLIIYGICAVVFESLKQPFMVISMIPLSFIGVFLTFYWFSVPFGQGGYASLLLLSGLTVNSALYIINDLNGIRKKNRNLLAVKEYIYAFRQKIVPIVLTIVSTVLSLVPFIVEGREELFWYSIALGTMGGLVFSVIGLVIVLPVMVRKI